MTDAGSGNHDADQEQRETSAQPVLLSRPPVNPDLGALLRALASARRGM
jgi:hypothetical protein